MHPADMPAARWETARQASHLTAQAWRRTSRVASLEARFGGAGIDDPRFATDRAVALLTDLAWVTALLDPLVAALASDPLFDPPLKVAREGGRTGVVLVETSAARVTASVATPAALAAGSSVIVPGRIGVTRYVRAGRARLERWRAPPLCPGGRADPAPARPQLPIQLGDGRIVVHDGRNEGHRLIDADDDVVSLSVTLRAGMLPMMREYDATDGRLIRSASTDDAGSRAAMLRRFLRASGRADAADVFAAATGDPAPHVRWGAMREWLALDARTAADRLATMADVDRDAEVRTVAAATLAMVRERLAPCPA